MYVTAEGGKLTVESAQGDHDYWSPYLERIDLAPAFPHRIVGDKSSSAWPYLRRHVKHNWYVDSRNPTVGFVSDDEVSILYNSARLVRGRPCLEIGCWRGWSTAHIARGSGNLEVIDPVLSDPVFLADVQASMERAGVLENVIFHPAMSPQAVRTISETSGKRWAFAFIDGDHDGDAPRHDAEVVSEFMADTALILFHDLASPFVADGLGFLADNGWNTKIYHTMQIMGVAWRGNIEPIDHVPDVMEAWELPAHLERFVSGRGAASALSVSNKPVSPDGAVSGTPRREAIVDRYPELFQKFAELLEKYTTTRIDLNEASKQNQILEERVATSCQEIATTRQTLADQTNRFEDLKASLVDFASTYQRKEGDYQERMLRAEEERLRSIDECNLARHELALAKSSHAAQATRYAKLEARLASMVDGIASGGVEVETIRALEVALHEREARLIHLSRQFEDRLAMVGQLQIFADWAVKPRTLIGLARRRGFGSAEPAVRLVFEAARVHSLPEGVARDVSRWLPRRRVLLGLLRRTLFAQAFTARNIVVDTLKASAPTFDPFDIGGDSVRTGPASVRDEGARTSAAKAIQTLEAEVNRLRPYEAAKLDLDSVVTELRVELAVLRHRAGGTSGSMA